MTRRRQMLSRIPVEEWTQRQAGQDVSSSRALDARLLQPFCPSLSSLGMVIFSDAKLASREAIQGFKDRGRDEGRGKRMELVFLLFDLNPVPVRRTLFLPHDPRDHIVSCSCSSSVGPGLTESRGRLSLLGCECHDSCRWLSVVI